MKKEYELTFTEIGRIQATDNKWIIVSSIAKGEEPKGWFLNWYIEDTDYTGNLKGGIKIPEEELMELLKLFGEENLKNALSELEGVKI